MDLASMNRHDDGGGFEAGRAKVEGDLMDEFEDSGNCGFFAVQPNSNHGSPDAMSEARCEI